MYIFRKYNRGVFMYQQICEFFQSIQFFSSAAFGIIAMLLYGGSWSFIGLYLGEAPRKGFEAAILIAVCNFVTFLFSIGKEGEFALLIIILLPISSLSNYYKEPYIPWQTCSMRTSRAPAF